MSHVFRFIGTRCNDQLWEIRGQEARHLQKVVRLAAGDVAEVTDMAGRWASGSITKIERDRIELSPSTDHVEPRPNGLRLWLGALKGNSFDVLLPTLCELGVSQITIIQQSGVPAFRTDPKAVKRWRRILEQSCKQCRRCWLPEVAVEASLDQALAADQDPEIKSKVLLEPTAPLLPTKGLVLPAVAAVGGERGFDKNELGQLVEGGFQPASLGPYILRATTAAAAIAALAMTVP